MSNQAQTPATGHAAHLSLPTEQEQSASSMLEYSVILQKYQSRIKQLESETRNLKKRVEECYDYIELQDYLAQKNLKKIQRLKMTLYSSEEGVPVVSIPAPLLKGLLVLGLGLYALFLFGAV